MTPKEKAKEMIESFMNMNMDIKQYPVIHYLTAKQCALIAVNEIIELAYWEYMESMGEKEEKYWQEVKQEIINLKSE
jgi:hypothetical protein